MDSSKTAKICLQVGLVRNALHANYFNFAAHLLRQVDPAHQGEVFRHVAFNYLDRLSAPKRQRMLLSIFVYLGLLMVYQDHRYAAVSFGLVLPLLLVLATDVVHYSSGLADCARFLEMVHGAGYETHGDSFKAEVAHHITLSGQILWWFFCWKLIQLNQKRALAPTAIKSVQSSQCIAPNYQGVLWLQMLRDEPRGDWYRPYSKLGLSYDSNRSFNVEFLQGQKPSRQALFKIIISGHGCLYWDKIAGHPGFLMLPSFVQRLVQKLFGSRLIDSCYHALNAQDWVEYLRHLLEQNSLLSLVVQVKACWAGANFGFIHYCASLIDRHWPNDLKQRLCLFGPKSILYYSPFYTINSQMVLGEEKFNHQLWYWNQGRLCKIKAELNELGRLLKVPPTLVGQSPLHMHGLAGGLVLQQSLRVGLPTAEDNECHYRWSSLSPAVLYAALEKCVDQGVLHHNLDPELLFGSWFDWVWQHVCCASGVLQSKQSGVAVAIPKYLIPITKFLTAHMDVARLQLPHVRQTMQQFIHFGAHGFKTLRDIKKNVRKVEFYIGVRMTVLNGLLAKTTPISVRLLLRCSITNWAKNLLHWFNENHFANWSYSRILQLAVKLNLPCLFSKLNDALDAVSVADDVVLQPMTSFDIGATRESATPSVFGILPTSASSATACHCR